MSTSSTETRRRHDDQKSRIDEYVTQLVEAAPPLGPEQRDRLALLLKGAEASRVASGSSVAVSPVAGTRIGSGGSS